MNPRKEPSLKTERLAENFGASIPWDINKIPEVIEKIKEAKKEMESAEPGLIEQETLEKLDWIICDLQRLRDIVLAKCSKNNIDPKKCCVYWWNDF